jgi:hypothetical protein
MAGVKIDNMIPFFKKQRATSILGLALDGNRLEAIVVRRLNGSLRVLQTATAPLALSPLGGDPELVGREIRNHLDQAGIRERRCAVCIPLNWVLTLQVKLPDLPEADMAGYLQIEAERGFTSGYENLFIVNSRFQISDGEKYATLLAVPRNHLETLEKVLKAAQLKPTTFSTGITALDIPDRDSANGTLTLALGHQSVDLLVGTGGGIVALRSLDAALEGEGAQKKIDADMVARELRITLGQLPGGLAEKTRTLRVFGRSDLARQFAGDISARAGAMGLKVEVMERVSSAQFDPPLPSDFAYSPALALSANWLKSAAPGPELIPPKVTPWQQLLSGKHATKKLAWAGAAAGFLVFCVCVAFGYQQWQISSLQSKWKGMEQKVADLQDAQGQIKLYRPWFDRSYRGLRMLNRLTEAFPEGGYVSAKNLKIRDLTAVTCSGVARDNQSYIKLIDQLQGAKEVSDLKTESLHGGATIDFTFSFDWEGGVKTGGN